MNESALYPGWETVRKIGSGSFGAVYEIARTLPNGKTEKAALKVISIPQNEGDVEELYSSGYDDASITAHFKSYLADIVNEYSLMAEIKGHTNIVYCDDIRYIQHDDGFGWDIFIKMELLTPLMKAKEPGAVEDTVKKLGADICSALVLCREKNIIHRDIKPQNIFVSEHGDYKLGDFGIAKTVEKTTGGTKIGTYGYMAPEVYNNQPYGAAADIYSLGLVMYWLLNEHRLPFLPMPPKVPTSTENEQARLRRFRGEPIPAPKNGSKALKRIVLKACAYDPKDRYHMADEMLEDLNRLNSECEAATKKTESSIQQPPEAPPDDAEDATSSILEESVDADKTEGTVGVFSQKEETAAELPRKGGNKKQRSSKKLYAAILGGVLLATLAVWMQSGEKNVSAASANAKASEQTTIATTSAIKQTTIATTEPVPVSIPSSTEIGDIVEFGCYEQDGNVENGAEPIEWYVISKDKDTNMLLLLSKYGLDNVQYHSENTDITWANCDLRKWLNSDNGFWGMAFGDEEKERIGNTLCKTSAHFESVIGGDDTVDKVFLLSLDEFWDNGIGGNEEWHRVSLTTYALSQKTQKNEWGDYLWWLRTPGGNQNVVCDGNTGGSSSDCLVNTYHVLRPAVWVTADGIEQTTAAIDHRPHLFSIDMTLDEFESKVALLIESATSWTKQSAPQTFEDFPFFPQSIFNLFDTVKEAQAGIEIADSTVTLKTNLTECLATVSPRNVSMVYDFTYYTPENAQRAFQFTQINDSTYTVQVSKDIWETSKSAEIVLNEYRSMENWNENLMVSYQIWDAHIDSPDITICMVNDDYNITWEYSYMDSYSTVDIYSYSSGRIWYMIYDMNTGRLVKMSK